MKIHNWIMAGLVSIFPREGTVSRLLKLACDFRNFLIQSLQRSCLYRSVVYGHPNNFKYMSCLLLVSVVLFSSCGFENPLTLGKFKNRENENSVSSNSNDPNEENQIFRQEVELMNQDLAKYDQYKMSYSDLERMNKKHPDIVREEDVKTISEITQ